MSGERTAFATAFGLLVGTAVLIALVPVGGDLWFHLATGDWIVRHNGLPGADPFSHTATAPLIVHGWLADLVLATTRAVAGYGGLRALQAALLLGALLAWARLLSVLGWARPLAAVLPFAVLVLFADRIRLRPDLVSFLCFPLLLVLLERWRRAGRVVCGPGVGAVALCVVWSNVHPAVLLAPVLAGGLWLGETLRRRWAEPAPRLPLAAPALLFLATCANPYGPKLYLYAFAVGSQVGAFVGEWGPSWIYFSRTTPLRWGHALAPWATLPLVGWGLWRARKAPGEWLAWLPVGLVAWGWALLSARFVYLLAVPLATCLPPAWRRPRHPTRLAAALAAAALLGLVLTRPDALLVALKEPRRAVRFGRPPYPVAEVAFLEHLPGPLRLWHPWNWGSWLADRLQGRHLIFSDGRLVLYGPRVLSDNKTLSRWPRDPGKRAKLRPRKEALLKEYRVDALLVPPKWWAPGPGWVRVERSPEGELWLRTATARELGLRSP